MLSFSILLQTPPTFRPLANASQPDLDASVQIVICGSAAWVSYQPVDKLILFVHQCSFSRPSEPNFNVFWQEFFNWNVFICSWCSIVWIVELKWPKSFPNFNIVKYCCIRALIKTQEHIPSFVYFSSDKSVPWNLWEFIIPQNSNSLTAGNIDVFRFICYTLTAH